MAKNQNRYQEMERYMAFVLIGDGVLFFLYLLCAGFGIIWLKVILAILAILVSGLCIAYLYLTGELLRYRSRWMLVGFAAVLLCLIVSLVLNYPSPNPLKKSTSADSSSENANTGADAAAYFIGDTYTL